ncbi:hypothetical protein [Streptomyces sp. NPDC090025]|uniref:hypothetical protein n=1 Tax=Streptomyces sp. NPDC090025 TaxID=3365922 RepID=UPI0038337D8F
MVRTRLRLAATLTVVVLALTGFQTSSGGSHGSGKSSGRSKSSSSGKSKGSGGGGGCSSSKKKNDDYDGYDDYSNNSGSSGGGSTSAPTPTPSASPDVRVEVMDCVEPAQKKRKGKPARKADTTTDLRLEPVDGHRASYRVTVEFTGANGSAVDRAETTVRTDGTEPVRFEVAMAHPGTVGQVRKCTVREVRELS